MDAYRNAYEVVGLDQRLADCALGKINLPVIGWGPAEWYGFPPAMIPICSTGSRPTYLGLWKHWFIDRPSSYVKMYVASGRQVIEVARTPDQLLTVIVMMSIANEDGIEPPLIEFAKQVRMDHQLDAIDAVSLETGDDAKGFVKLKSFQVLTPQSSVDDLSTYDGSFPLVIDRVAPADSCSFELVNRIPDASLPGWIRASDRRQEAFEQRLSEKKFGEAWLLLNSTGWAIGNARTALQSLVRASNNRELGVVADAWCSVADTRSGSY